jgi:hypothetical protein
MDASVTLLKLANLEFEKPVHGVPLLNSEGNLMSIPHREQLIIGNPLNVRSMQLISTPFSFILNFDFFHKFWYISRQENVPENRFRKVRKEWIHFKRFEKKDYYEIRINFPYIARKGFNFEVLRFDVKKDRGFIVGHRLSESTWSKGKRFKDKKTGTVTAFFPVTPRDSILGYIGVEKGTEITNLRFTSLSEKEFLKLFSGAVEKIKNQKIFESLRTLRKSRKIDELYNLDGDVPMEKNLLKKHKDDYTKRVVESKKKIYHFLEVYYKDMKKLLGTLKRERTLSEEEKEMLESLGYL